MNLTFAPADAAAEPAASLITEMREELEARLSDRRMTFKTHVVEGLENLPAAFHSMFTGQSFGKTVVRV